MKSSHFELAMRANGKAEIYFHSYFWTTYIDKLASACGQDDSEQLANSPEIARMRSLSTRPQLVLDKIKSLPFGVEQYKQFVESFGSGKQVKRVELIEQLSRHLFVAQIHDNKESLKLIEKVLI